MSGLNYTPEHADRVIRERDEQSKLIESMFARVEESLDEKNQRNDFIESIRDQFDRTGKLSERQFQALENFYVRLL